MKNSLQKDENFLNNQHKKLTLFWMSFARWANFKVFSVSAAQLEEKEEKKN